jgi:hypothetical protein
LATVASLDASLAAVRRVGDVLADLLSPPEAGAAAAVFMLLCQDMQALAAI